MSVEISGLKSAKETNWSQVPAAARLPQHLRDAAQCRNTGHENPFLYDLTVEFRENDIAMIGNGERLEGENGRTIDRVSGYFGLQDCPEPGQGGRNITSC